ncbi:MAG: SDR family oxidoreductase [Neisseriaceae bacterium]|nr:SDR family oxidoreductase [Neisseriaceae bacterium]
MSLLPQKVALVIGAHGIIGGNLIEVLSQQSDWQVIGVSRRAGESRGRVRYMAVDLLDREATLCELSALTSVTHVFYAAYQDRQSWAELVAPNLAMLVNVMDAIEPVAKSLQHVLLMQGYKAYGAHLGPFKTPARESDADHMPPEFNLDQQQFLMQRQRQAGWAWTALRPSVVCGFASGVPMNLVMAIAQYAAMSKELGLPLRFPGQPGAYDRLLEVSDATLLAKGMLWAVTEPKAANQVYNLNNGDLFRWRELWPQLADYF